MPRFEDGARGDISSETARDRREHRDHHEEVVAVGKTDAVREVVV